MSSLRVLISGGGTGGHIFPAIAIGNALVKIEPEVRILFVGAKGKMEMEKVPEAGFEIVGLPIRGINRNAFVVNLKVPFLLLYSLWKSMRLILKFKPDVVIGVGGYASAAIVLTASLFRINTIIQEQNSYPGFTNRILSRRAKLICVAFEGMEKHFPKEKIKLLGNPIRLKVVENPIKAIEARLHFNLDPDRFTILITGGSLGARTLNSCAINLSKILAVHNAQLLWQCGNTYYESNLEKVIELKNEHVHLFRFIKEMGLAYAASDLVIARAGAITISEISILKKPSILIPSPNVAEDHQTSNARVLTERNAALLLADHEAPRLISSVIGKLLKESNGIEKIRKNLETVYSSKTAAEDIAAEILILAKKK